MGRPPLFMKVIPVRLPPEVIERIDALGTYGRAKFIREAVENELAQRGEKGARG
jgi:predicted DNA-binding protein